MRFSITIAIPAFALIIACSQVPAQGDKGDRPPFPPPEAAPSVAQLKSATFSGVFDHPVTLKEGVYEGRPVVEGGASRPRVVLWDHPIAFGDLDGAPGEEAAVLLSESSGGSGERVYVASVGVRGGELANLGTTLVGDRVKIRTFHVADRRIVMDVVEAGPKDALCCPTQLARKSYALRNGTLRMVSSEVTGTLSLATLAGMEWTLVEIDSEPLPAGVRPPTATFEGTRIFGFGGCNRYMGGVGEAGPGSMTVGPLASTRMACPPPEMGIEDRFLAGLAKINRYTFLGSRLALSGMEGDKSVTLIFTGNPANAPGPTPPAPRGRE